MASGTRPNSFGFDFKLKTKNEFITVFINSKHIFTKLRSFIRDKFIYFIFSHFNFMSRLKCFEVMKMYLKVTSDVI